MRPVCGALLLVPGLDGALVAALLVFVLVLPPSLRELGLELELVMELGYMFAVCGAAWVEADMLLIVLVWSWCWCWWEEMSEGRGDG